MPDPEETPEEEEETTEEAPKALQEPLYAQPQVEGEEAPEEEASKSKFTEAPRIVSEATAADEAAHQAEAEDEES